MNEYSLGLYEKAMSEALSWEQRLETARRCGFDRLEISVDESEERLARLRWSDEQRESLRHISEEQGVPIATMCLSAHRKYPLGARDAETRRRSREILLQAVELAQALGVRVIQLAGYDVYYEPGDETTRAYFEEGLRECVAVAARAGVSLGFETMENDFMDTVSKAMVFVNRMQSPYLGVYPDIGNLSNASERYHADLLADLSVGQGHIFAAHLKETRPGVYRNLLFGEGQTPYEPCLRQLYRMGVRMFTGEFWYQGEADNELILSRASAFLRARIESAIQDVKRARTA